MAVKYVNYLKTTIADAGGINGSQTTMQPASTAGWPTLGVGDYFYATLVKVSSAQYEIVKVTSYTSTTATIERAADGTAALTLVQGDEIQLWPTRAMLLDMIAEVNTAITTVNLVTANYTALSIPGTALQDNFLAIRMIPDGLITGSKLNAAVAGDGLGIDGSGNLKLNTSTTIGTSGDAPRINPASIDIAHLAHGQFVALKQTDVGSTGTTLFYKGGARPFSPVFGDGNDGGRIVHATVQNDHATQDALIGVTVGPTLDYYTSGGTDGGVVKAKDIYLKNKNFFSANQHVQLLTFFVPAGYRYMFLNDNNGTPNVISHIVDRLW